MRKQLLEPEKACPECKGTLNWKVIHNFWGAPMYSGLCGQCNIVLKNRETPDLRNGRLLAEELKITKTLDPRLTRFNGDVQIGYFRAIQHCATCENNIGDSCNCTDCDCIYCREYNTEA